MHQHAIPAEEVIATDGYTDGFHDGVAWVLRRVEETTRPEG